MENLIRPQIVNRLLPRSAEMPNDLFKRKKDEMRKNPYYQKMMKYMPKELRNELANDDKAENELAFSGGEEESFNESQNQSDAAILKKKLGKASEDVKPEWSDEDGLGVENSGNKKGKAVRFESDEKVN